MTSTPSTATARVSGLRLGWALFAGILAWLGHLIGLTGVNGWVCRTGQLWPFHALTVAALAVCLHALWVSWRISRDDRPEQGVQAARFLGFTGLVINTFNVALVVAEWVPVVFVHPCATG